MKPLIKLLVDIANSKLGSHEEGGNNKGKDIVEYQKATWLAPAPWAWCAAFMAWCQEEWLKNPEVQAHFGLKSDNDILNWRCRDASAFGWIEWGQKHGAYITDEKELALAGDIIVFDFSHIGLVVEDQLPGKDYVETIEGNTNNAGLRDSETGDGVWKKNRKTNLVRAYIRLIK